MSVTYTVKYPTARVGLPGRALRYYDRIGLVCPPRTAPGYRVDGPEEEGRRRFVVCPPRTAPGYRVDGPEEEGRRRFVRQPKTLGFSLEEIRDLIAVAERVPEVERLLDDKIDAIDAQVAKLGGLRERLVAYRAGASCACGLPRPRRLLRLSERRGVPRTTAPVEPNQGGDAMAVSADAHAPSRLPSRQRTKEAMR